MSVLTFTDYLLSFAKAVDSLDKKIYTDVLGLVQKYFERIGVVSYSAMIDGVRVNNVPGLQQIWGNNDNATIVSIHNAPAAQADATYPIKETDKYSFQSAYVYDTGNPIWIVSGDPALSLMQVSPPSYHDQWNDPENAKPFTVSYQDGSDGKAFTAVYVPLKTGKRVFGVLNFEFERRLELTQMKRAEVLELAAAMETLFWLRQTTKQSCENTQEAFSRFEKRMDHGGSALTASKVFLASSDRADSAVISCIVEVVETFNSLELISWKKNEMKGRDIMGVIAESIEHSSFGICYLSDPNPNAEAVSRGEEPYFVDNSNVLFELGMLHALKQQKESDDSLWIAIRERPPEDNEQKVVKVAAKVPFDLAGMPILFVPRKVEQVDGVNKLVVDKIKLKENLSEQINQIIQQL